MYHNTSEDVPYVQPLYYGLWAFNTFIANRAQLYSVSVASTNNYIKVWYSVADDGTGRVMVIHKDMAATVPADVTINLPSSLRLSSPATLLRLTPGPAGVYANDGLSFAGLTYDGSTDGNPRGTLAPEYVQPNAAHTAYSFTVTPLSLVVLELPSH